MMLTDIGPLKDWTLSTDCTLLLYIYSRCNKRDRERETETERKIM